MTALRRSDRLYRLTSVFTDIPATNGYPKTVVFHANEPMTMVEMGGFNTVRNLKGADPVHRDVRHRGLDALRRPQKRKRSRRALTPELAGAARRHSQVSRTAASPLTTTYCGAVALPWPTGTMMRPSSASSTGSTS